MERRKPSLIIKQIIYELREEPLSLRALESKVNTNNETIKEYTKLLEDLNLAKLNKVKRGSKRITVAELLPAGRQVK